jgi:DNA topoisomerase-1
VEKEFVWIKNLVIVESPAKAKTIGKVLGEGFSVKSCFGHIRDLSKKKLGIDHEKGFTPEYIVEPDKKELVRELTKSQRKLQWCGWLPTTTVKGELLHGI